jgi:hypothetical protein
LGHGNPYCEDTRQNRSHADTDNSLLSIVGEARHYCAKMLFEQLFVSTARILEHRLMDFSPLETVQGEN